MKKESKMINLPDQYNIIFDTGNSHYTLIGENIVKELNLDRLGCDEGIVLSGVIKDASVKCKQYVNLIFQIPYFSDDIHTIKAYIDNNHPDQILFGWNSGLDVLFENDYVIYKQKNENIVEKYNRSYQNDAITRKYNRNRDNDTFEKYE